MRKRTWESIMAIFLAMCLASAAMGAWLGEQQTSMYELHLPPVLSSMEIARWAQILSLSEAQAHALQTAYEQDYLPHRQDAERKELPGLIEISRKASSLTAPGQMTAEIATGYQEFNEKELSVSRTLIGCEQPLLDLVASMLTDEQTEKLARVKAFRQRSRCTLINREIPASRIDLSAMLGELATEQDFIAADSIMSEYEQLLTPLTLRLEEVSRRWTVDRLFVLAKHKQIGLSTPQQKADYMKEVRAHTQSISQLQLRIARLNTLYLSYIADVVTAETRDALRAQYQIRAYPTVYPDADQPDKEYRELLASKDLPDDVRAAAAEMWQLYRDRHELICKRMCDAEDSWLANATLTEDWTDYPDQKAYVEGLRAQRHELDERTREQIRSLKAMSADSRAK